MWKAVAILGGFGAFFSTIIAITYARMNSFLSEKEQNIVCSLPRLNCGKCGFPNCEAYVKSLVKGEAEVGKCLVGGDELKEKLLGILRDVAPIVSRKVAVLKCGGDKLNTFQRFEYWGAPRCDTANIICSGPKSCTYGCIGFGDCVNECKYNAISMGENGLPLIDEKRCTGCRLCVEVCPKGLLTLISREQKLYIGCNSLENPKTKNLVCKTACIGCGLCERNCPYKAIEIKDGCADIKIELCRNCGICVSKCPTNAIIDKLKARPKAIIGSECIGCEKCKEVCPAEAIEGLQDKQHKVLLDKCIGCALCYKVCEPKAITMAFSLGYVEP